MSFLVSYMSLEQGWTATVVQAVDEDAARALAVLAFGVPNRRTPMVVQRLDGLPSVYEDARHRLHVGSAMVLPS
jgi:hypothetical protein